MADGVISVEKVKAFWRSQVQDDRNWEVNKYAADLKPWGITIALRDFKSLLRAAGMFVGAVILMREYGDLMAV